MCVCACVHACVRECVCACVCVSLSLSLSPEVAAPTCVVLLQAAHTFCVSVLYLHVVFDDKHVLSLMCVHACIYVYPRSS